MVAWEAPINLRSTLDCMVQCPPSWHHKHRYQVHHPPEASKQGPATYLSIKSTHSSCSTVLSPGGQEPGIPEIQLILKEQNGGREEASGTGADS